MLETIERQPQMPPLHVKLTDEVFETLTRFATHHGVTRTGFIQALAQWIHDAEGLGVDIGSQAPFPKILADAREVDADRRGRKKQRRQGATGT